MKTISPHINTHNHGIDSSITTERSFGTARYYEYDDHAAGDMNRNADVSKAEYQRNACEEELYRLRYGIERLLSGNEQGDFGGSQRQRSGFGQNPFRRMMSRTADLINRKNKSWLERCTPCCRRGRRGRYNDNADIHNTYASRDGYNDGLLSGRIPKSPSQARGSSNSFGSISPSRSVSSHFMGRNRSPTGSQLGRMTAGNFDDPAYQSLILKILEAKALDCLCTGYSKKNTQKQMSQALDELNQRADDHQRDSASVTSSRLSSSSYDSSRTGSDASFSSSPGLPQLNSPSPSQSQTGRLSPPSDRAKGSSRSNGRHKRSKSKSNVTIRGGKTPSSSKSRRKKRASSKHRRKSNKKSGRSKQSNQKRSKSKRSHRKHSKSRTSKKRPASSRSRKKSTSSKTRSRKSPSKSRSRSKTRKKRKSKRKKGSRKKRTKAKSNNQVNDEQTVKLPTLIYPPMCQKVYENRQKLVKLLLSSTT